VDLLTGHVGAMDCCARALKAAAKMLEDQTLEDALRRRYAAWESPAAQKMLAGEVPLEAIEARVRDTSLNPEPVSGRQEYLENIVNRYV
jgi:xylose isomerase